jgi:uncharacterized protein (DUF697 family)
MILKNIKRAVRSSLSRAYGRIQVDPGDYLQRIRRTYGLPIQSFQDMFSVPEKTVEYVAEQTISASVKIAALEGAGLGLGGMLTIAPDIGILSAVLLRMIQKLSLIYGFEYSSDEEVAALWVAAAAAAGIDLGRELLEKEVIERFVPRVMERIAVRMSAEVAEKWSARLIPILSGAIGGTLNYYFVREWGRRSRIHFREKHQLVRRQLGVHTMLRAPSIVPPKLPLQ